MSGETTGLSFRVRTATDKIYCQPGHVQDDYEGLSKVNSTDLVEIAPVDHAQNSRPELPILLCPCSSNNVPIGEVHVDKHILKEHLKDDEYVHVNLVKDIAEKKIGLIELYIKDAYISRIDMRVVTTELNGRCLVENQSLKINSFGLTVKSLIDSGGKSIKKGGIVTKDTRFAFRSASALFYLFIQISEEMWHYDAYGYKQYQRAIDGFLHSLLSKWLGEKCAHEVHIVFYARHLYAIDNLENSHTNHLLDNFPDKWKNNVHKLNNKYLYIDHYRTLTESGESLRPDSSSKVSQIISQCRGAIINWISDSQIYFPDGKEAPRTVTDGPRFQLSSAPQANFVEAINMSLHIFERHQKDRVLDRTGQMILVISAGVGVYDCTHHLPLSPTIGFNQRSDQRTQYRKDLYKKTQHRIRDLGIGLDVLCLGEQPLHVVPLFRLYDADGHIVRYERPDFINLNYYRESPITVEEDLANIKYVPRIHFQEKDSSSAQTLARAHTMPAGRNREARLSSSRSHISPKSPMICLSKEEMDAYDNAIFMPESKSYHKSISQSTSMTRKVSQISEEGSPKSNFNKNLLLIADHNSSSWDPKRYSSQKRSTGRTRHESVSNDFIYQPHRLIPRSNPFGATLSPDKSRPRDIKTSSSAHMSANLVIPEDVSKSDSRSWTSSSFGAVQLTNSRSAMSVTINTGYQGTMERRRRRISQCDSSTKDYDRHDSYSFNNPCSINPFNVSGTSISRPVTYTNHQWVDLFPSNSDGQPIQPHHRDFVNKNVIMNDVCAESFRSQIIESLQIENSTISTLNTVESPQISSTDFQAGDSSRLSRHENLQIQNKLLPPSTNVECLDTRIGVDWKSMTYPACLPLTTAKKLNANDLTRQKGAYKHANPYKWIQLDNENRSEFAFRSIKEKFYELVNQRIAQGFQIVRSYDDGQKKRDKDSTTETMVVLLGPFVHHFEYNNRNGATKGVDSPLKLTCYGNQWETMALSESSIYKFSFAIARNRFEPREMDFLPRFGRGLLKVENLDKVIEKPIQENLEDYQLQWDRYSWKCRFVFVMDKKLSAEPKNIKEAQDNFLKLLGEVINDNVEIDTKPDQHITHLPPMGRKISQDNSARASSPKSMSQSFKAHAEKPEISPGRPYTGNATDLDNLVMKLEESSIPFYRIWKPNMAEGAEKEKVGFFSLHAVRWLISHWGCADKAQAKEWLSHLLNTRRILAKDDNESCVRIGFYFYHINKNLNEDDDFLDQADDYGLDEEEDEENCIPLIEVKFPEMSDYRILGRLRNECKTQTQTIKKIIPRGNIKTVQANCEGICCSNNQQRFEWYQVYYCPRHNPIFDGFTLMHQWLAATPAKICESAHSMMFKAKKFGFNVIPCPEDPFDMSGEPFKHVIKFDIRWVVSNQEKSWHEKLNKLELVDIMFSIFFDLGFYYDSYFKQKTAHVNIFQFIHKSGSSFLQVEVKSDKTPYYAGYPESIKWISNPLIKSRKWTISSPISCEELGKSTCKEIEEISSDTSESGRIYEQYLKIKEVPKPVELFN